MVRVPCTFSGSSCQKQGLDQALQSGRRRLCLLSGDVLQELQNSWEHDFWRLESRAVTDSRGARNRAPTNSEVPGGRHQRADRGVGALIAALGRDLAFDKTNRRLSLI